MPDPGSIDDVTIGLLAQSLRQKMAQAARSGVQQFGTAVGNAVAPNLTDYLANGPSPQTSQSMTPYPSGKLPSTDPRLTSAVQEVGNTAAVAPMMAAAPELGMLGRAAPELAGRVAGALPQVSERAIADVAGGIGGMQGMTTPAYAGERPTITQAEQDQLTKIDGDIGSINAQRAAAIKKVPRSRGDWDSARYNGAIQQAGAPYDKMLDAANQQKAAINDAVNQRGVTFDAQQAAASAAQQPLSVRNPDALNAVRAAAQVASPAVGGLLGYKGFGPLRALGSGVIAGAAPNLASNVNDYATGGDARKQALQNFNDPDWWKYAIGGEAGVAGLTSLMGSELGEAIRRRAPVEPMPNGQSLTPPANPPAGPGGKVWPDRMRPDIDMKQGADGRWYQVGTGHKVPERLYPPTGGKGSPGNQP